MNKLKQKKGASLPNKHKNKKARSLELITLTTL